MNLTEEQIKRLKPLLTKLVNEVKMELAETIDYDKIDKKIMSSQPKTVEELEKILKSFEVNYKIVPVRHYGYLQGVKVRIGGKKTLPGNGMVYSVFKP